MGASMGGPWGAAAGAGLGAITSFGDLGTAFGFRDAEIAAEEMKKVSAELREGFSELKNSFAVLGNFDSATTLERIKALRNIVEAVETIEKGDKPNEVVTRMRSGVREKLNIDEILASGGRKGLPKGGLDQLEKQLAEAEAEILSAAGRGELSSALNSMRSAVTFESAGFAVDGPMRFSPEARNRVGEIREDFQRKTYTDEVQSALVNVPAESQFAGGLPYNQQPSGVDALTAIRDATLANNKAIDEAAKSGGGIDIDEQKAIGTESVRIAKLFAKLLGRASLVELEKELNDAVAGAGGKGDVARGNRMALGHYMGGLVDERFQGFINPQAMGAETATGTPAATGGMTQGELERQFRDAREGLLGESLDSKYGAARKIGRRKRYFAGRAADRANAGRMAGITMGADNLIGEQGRLKKETIEDKSNQARRETVLKQEDKLNQEELKLQETLIKDIKAITMPIKMQSDLLEKIVPKFKDISDEQLDVELKNLDAANKATKASGESDEKLNNQQLAQIKYLEGLKKRRATIDKETDHLTGEINKSREKENDIIDKGTAARIKERKAMLSFQLNKRVDQIDDKAFQTGEEARGLRVLRDKGYGITEREIADADRASRRAGIRQNTRGRASFGEIFGETNAYGKNDHLLEFEDGMTSVAENMKSSFADAFKSISSGASSGKEALKAFADSILNSISDISAKMATNMLFSSMGGKAQGGYIPRFQSGGVVTGGSGFKDDVPALMSGGEYVIKKSSAQKIGYGTLNAINSGGSRGGSIPHYAEGGSTAGSGGFTGMDMAKMYGVSAAASMASGYLNRPDKTEKQVSRNYGLGRDEYGYFGGADPDAGGGDAVSGGGRRAGVSLNKAFAYYRRDPVTGQLISERARPTEGRFETSSLLSTRGLLREDDPQTARMFGKEGKMADYQQTRAEWKKNKEDTLTAHYKAQNARTIGAWANAAMIIGVGAYTGGFGGGAGGAGGGGSDAFTGFDDVMGPSGPVGYQGASGNNFNTVAARGGSIPKFAEGGSVSPAMLMGGEYVMSPEAVRTHGVNFMSELNRGNVPGGAGGGFFSGGGGGGAAMSGSAPTTNNVKININIDKSGKSEVGASTETFADGGKDERDTNNEAQDNKAMAELLQGVVLSEITKQQRPGGLLQNSRP